MRKKLLASALVLALGCVTVAGCSNKDNNGGSKNDNSSASGELTADEVTLTVWESTLGPDKFIEQAGEKFTELHPNIKIEYVNVEVGDSTSQIALDGPAGVGPDLFAAPHDKLGELVSGGYVLPTANPDEVQETVLSSCSSALTYDGKMYGYPVSAETYTLFYNKDLIDEADVPTTWEDLKTFAKDFNDKNSGKYGFMMDVGNGYYSIIFTTSEDNRLFGPDGSDTTNTNINSEASKEGMEFFQGLREILDVPSADLATATCDGAFAEGNVALYITGLWNVSSFTDSGLNFGVAPLPSLPGNDEPCASFSGTRAMFVSAYTDHQAEAEAFAEFLLTEEMQQLRFELTGSLPSINCEVDSPYIEGFLKQLDYAFPMPSIPQMAKFWDAMNAASANIWDGADVSQELDACNDAILAE